MTDTRHIYAITVMGRELATGTCFSTRQKALDWIAKQATDFPHYYQIKVLELTQ